MTIGIYLLKFTGTNKSYVGQSINIERRFSKHLNDMRKQQHSAKMNKAFIEYGEATLHILQTCKVEELSNLENHFIKLYDCVKNGFNTMEEAQSFPVLLGENNAFAKYSNESIVNVLRCLILFPEATIAEVAKITNVHASTVKNIHNGYGHKWLEKDYPIEYSLLIKRRENPLAINTSKQKGIQRPPIISPEGIIYSNIDNIAKFAREHGLNQGALTGVFNGKAKTHKGWKLKQ